MILIRIMEQQNFEFFMDMHYKYIHIMVNKPPKHELLTAPNIIKYSEGWGRIGDKESL
jgi:hypothetical protein